MNLSKKNKNLKKKNSNSVTKNKKVDTLTDQAVENVKDTFANIVDGASDVGNKAGKNFKKVSQNVAHKASDIKESIKDGIQDNLNKTDIDEKLQKNAKIVKKQAVEKFEDTKESVIDSFEDFGNKTKSVVGTMSAKFGTKNLNKNEEAKSLKEIKIDDSKKNNSKSNEKPTNLFSSRISQKFVIIGGAFVLLFLVMTLLSNTIPNFRNGISTFLSGTKDMVASREQKLRNFKNNSDILEGYKSKELRNCNLNAKYTEKSVQEPSFTVEENYNNTVFLALPQSKAKDNLIILCEDIDKLVGLNQQNALKAMSLENTGNVEQKKAYENIYGSYDAVKKLSVYDFAKLLYVENITSKDDCRVTTVDDEDKKLDDDKSKGSIKMVELERLKNSFSSEYFVCKKKTNVVTDTIDGKNIQKETVIERFYLFNKDKNKIFIIATQMTNNQDKDILIY
jgi:hypothetical protein